MKTPKKLPKGIFRKYVCPSCRPTVYRRDPGPCPKCGSPLKKGPLAIQYNCRGGRKTENVKDSNSIKYAQALLAKRQAQAGEGFVLPAKMTWADLADEWLDLEACKHEDGGERMRYAVKRLKKYFGKLPIGKMVRKDLLGYVKERREEVKSATLAKEVRTFRQIWKHGKASDYVGGNPWEGVKVSEGLPPIKSPLTEEEGERLFDALPRQSRPLYRFLILTGCRGKEARFLLKKDVDLKLRIVWVRGKTQESEEDLQAVHLDDEAVEIVEEALAAKRNQTDYLFPNLKTQKPYVNIKSTFNRAVVRAGLKGKVQGPHDLRHLFVSYLIMGDVHPITAATLSRHKDLRMLKRYSHLASDHLQAALKSKKKCN
jgi:integrase